ncbi:hypothetical protein [Rhodococcus opacus]|uniref:hypothetical protein n=1 Tax=Rhodococcus opacus TaxID=37919 RepID=UPI00155A2293|nr:hypothetical protein [Rhodococcus opacus]
MTSNLRVADFGMQSWPRRLEAIPIEVFRGESKIESRRVQVTTEDGSAVLVSPSQRLDAWQAILPAGMHVRPFQAASYHGRPVAEFPAAEAGKEIRAAYAQTTRAIASLDDHRTFRPVQRESALRSLAESWQSRAVLPSTIAGDHAAVLTPLQSAYNFYRHQAQDTASLGAAGMSADEAEFHRVVAGLADHPTLMRVLGLVMDFAVPVAALSSAGSNELRVRPRWPTPDPDAPIGWTNAEQEDVLPRTAFVLAGSRFVPLTPPQAGIQRPQGMLRLAGAGLPGDTSNPDFEFTQFDIDGAALRMVNIAQSDAGQVPSDALRTAGLPTLRSTGLALIQKNRIVEHLARVERASVRSTIEGIESAPLTAENLVAGYRVDVLDDGKWLPLCRRRVRYNVNGILIGHEAGRPGLLEEVYVRHDSATTGASGSGPLYIHQVVARWGGWGHAVRRPDRVIESESPIARTNSPIRPSFTTEVEQDAGTLPRLRFGREYRIRVRLADLVGGGLRSSEVRRDEEWSNKLLYRRFEPLLAPELAPSSRYVDGAGANQMVIRSDRLTSVTDYSEPHDYARADVRYLLPPKSPLDLAIQHQIEGVGVFDSALGPNAADAEVRRQFEIAKRADKDLGDMPGADTSGSYVVVPEAHDAVSLPWLADVAAYFTGLVLPDGGRPIDPSTGNEGATEGFRDSQGNNKFLWPWLGEWPDRLPIALRVEEADSSARTGCTALMQRTGNRRTFTVKLKQAEQVTLELFSGTDEDFVPCLGVAHWGGIRQHHPPTDPLFQHVYRGGNPMVTPPRTVTMVHAVQRPLSDPVGRFIALRAMGATDTVLDTQLNNTATFSVHVPSTGSIDIRAEWTDIIDNPTEPKPKQVRQRANVGAFAIAHKPPRLRPPDGAFPVIRHELGDTRRRRVTYTVDATSRFRSFFDRITKEDPGACTVTGILNATDVPSSARPSTPKVRYVVPAFHWTRTMDTSGTIFRSSRRGGCLRVLLERPWFTTGPEEALAVLAWQGSQLPNAKQLEMVTIAGRDPLWKSGVPPAVVGKSHFATAVATDSVVVPEIGATVAAVVSPIDPMKNFDPDAGCWFADIDLSPIAATSYFPFIRLALARYQAGTADPNQRLSPPIQTEPIQLFPQRDLTIKRTPETVVAVVADPNPAAARLNKIRAELQVFTGDPRTALDGPIGGPGGWNPLRQRTGVLGENLSLELPHSEGRPMRVSITESEMYSGDATRSTRIVYADNVTIPFPTAPQ